MRCFLTLVLGYLFKIVKIVIVLEKTPESPLDCKEIKSVKPKGNQRQKEKGGQMVGWHH